MSEPIANRNINTEGRVNQSIIIVGDDNSLSSVKASASTSEQEGNQKVVTELKGLLDESDSAFVIDYKGLSVSEIGDLRNRLRDSGAVCKISKNTLLKRAIDGQEQWKELESLLTGTSAVLLTKEDIGSAVKAYKQFQKEVKRTELRGGVLEGKLLGQKAAEALADLPTKDELYRKIAIAINAIPTRLAFSLESIPTRLAFSLESIPRRIAMATDEVAKQRHLYSSNSSEHIAESIKSGSNDFNVIGSRLQKNKIDAFLHSAFALLDQGYRPEGIGLLEDENGTFLFPMMVEVCDPSWQSENLPDYQELSRLGRFIGFWGSQKTVQKLAEDSSVVYVEASVREGVLNSTSILSERDLSEACDFLTLTNAKATHEKERGDKAIVAIIDTGIDVLHETFLGSDGRTRIVGILDLDQKIEYTSCQINEFVTNQSVPESLGRDPGTEGLSENGLHKGGHGTHVASIAAGKPTKNFTGGISPESKIIVVKISEIPIEGYLNNFISALSYIQKIARNFSLPVVVNVSLGFHSGAHDGTSGIERLFDSSLLDNSVDKESGKVGGFAIVKSAGNDKTTKQHAALSIPASQSTSFSWGRRNARLQDVIEVWFDTRADLEFELKSPANFNLSLSAERSKIVGRHGERQEKGKFSNGNSYVIEYTVLAVCGLSQLLVTVHRGDEDTVNPGIWTLDVTNLGTRKRNIHAWIRDSENHKGTCCFQDAVDQNVTITVPGTGQHVITVAALRQPLNPQRKPTPWDHSSRGPTRDKRHKPDISSFGHAIVAACSNSNSDVCRMDGTSMSAPQVTGAIALLLSAREKKRELNPNLSQLTSFQISEGVKLSAQKEGDVFSWDESSGYGLINVGDLLDCLDLFE